MIKVNIQQWVVEPIPLIECQNCGNPMMRNTEQGKEKEIQGRSLKGGVSSEQVGEDVVSKTTRVNWFDEKLNKKKEPFRP